jgi:hypothetical protein
LLIIRKILAVTEVARQARYAPKVGVAAGGGHDENQDHILIVLLLVIGPEAHSHR